MTTLQAAGFINKLAGGWFAPSSPLPAMDASLKAAPSKGMTGSTPPGTTPGMRPSATTSKGLGDRGKPSESYALKMKKAGEGKASASELKKGIKVEKEHVGTVGNSPAQFESIAKDHLEERPDYYTQLAKMEAKPVGGTMKDAAIKGFMDKCAELGVDPTAAIKYAGGFWPRMDRWWWNTGRWRMPFGITNEGGKRSSLMWGKEPVPAKPVKPVKPTSAPTGGTGVSVPGTAAALQERQTNPNNEWMNVPGNR